MHNMLVHISNSRNKCIRIDILVQGIEVMYFKTRVFTKEVEWSSAKDVEKIY